MLDWYWIHNDLIFKKGISSYIRIVCNNLYGNFILKFGILNVNLKCTHYYFIDVHFRCQ